MYTEVTFQTDTNTEFAQMLQDSGIGCSFMKEMLESLFGLTDSMAFSETDFVEHLQAPEITTNDEGDMFYIQGENVYSNTRRAVSVQDWWEGAYNSDTTPIGGMGIFIGEMSSQVKAATSSELEFYKKMILIIMAGRLRTLISEKIRTFDKIISGEEAYSETLMYRVAKYSGEITGDGSNLTAIQNFWIPNSNDVDIVKFIDSQVKYGEKYTYIVYAYQAVLGVEYEYSDLRISRTVSQNPAYCIELIDQETGEPVTSYFDDTEQMIENPNYSGVYETSKASRFVAEFKSTYRPSFQMIEVPTLSFVGNLIDNPPLSPEIDIIPYIGASNRIRFLLSGRVGEESHIAIPLSAADIEAYDVIRQAKKLESFEPITFSADDFPYSYEIYRITTRPKSYKDFEGSILATVQTIISSVGAPKYATAVAYEDKINPNKKYYYIFRAIDIHGNISNPSPVYEFEIVDDGSSMYPLYKTIDIEEPISTTVFKKARRLIHLVPNVRHRLINEEQSGFADVETAIGLGKKMVLGDTDDPIWNNKFKVRLTSKKTGRKIDLNLQFTTEHIVTDMEQN